MMSGMYGVNSHLRVEMRERNNELNATPIAVESDSDNCKGPHQTMTSSKDLDIHTSDSEAAGIQYFKHTETIDSTNGRMCRPTAPRILASSYNNAQVSRTMEEVS